jgi:hypothetical protein
MNDEVEKLRHGFRPAQVTVLFIGESAPPGGKTFFYSGDSNLYRAMREAFNGGDEFLPEFTSKGYFLDDLVLFPADKITEKEQGQFLAECRRDRYTDNIRSLSARIIAYRPQGIVLLLSGRGFDKAVLKALEEANAGLTDTKVQHYGTAPFPNRYHYRQFLEEMSRIIPKLPILQQRGPVPHADNHIDPLHAIERALALLHSVQALEGTDKDSVEHLLDVALQKLRGE